MSQQDFDIVIVGGGMVGATLAYALKDLPLSIAVVEHALPQQIQHASYDARSVALSYGSKQILSGLGLWESIVSSVCPIEHIHISELGHFGFSRLSAIEEGVEALGYVVEAHRLGQVLLEQVPKQPNVTWFCPATFTSLMRDEAGALVEIAYQDRTLTLRCECLVAADGGRSPVREAAGIQTQVQEYRQTAIVANISTDLAHRGCAYERFTAAGPVALLPLNEQRMALVRTVYSTESHAHLVASDDTFLSGLQEIFGFRLGRFTKVGQRFAYPLAMVRAKQQVQPHLVLLGNAAHTLHPVAGQGLNLGLRDVALFAEHIAASLKQGKPLGDYTALMAYEDARAVDQERMMLLTNALVKTFSNTMPLLTWVRNAALLAHDLNPLSRHMVARTFMGMMGPLPKLARELALSER